MRPPGEGFFKGEQMRIKDGFVLREVAGQTVVIAVGAASEKFHGMINMNQTGRMIWEGVSRGKSVEEIASELEEACDHQVAYERILSDTETMIRKMRDAGVIEE